MKKVYCCYTNYHLLISLLKAKKGDDLVLFDVITDVDEKIDKLKNNNFFSNIYLKNLEEKNFEKDYFIKQYI